MIGFQKLIVWLLRHSINCCLCIRTTSIWPANDRYQNQKTPYNPMPFRQLPYLSLFDLIFSPASMRKIPSAPSPHPLCYYDDLATSSSCAYSTASTPQLITGSSRSDTGFVIVQLQTAEERWLCAKPWPPLSDRKMTSVAQVVRDKTAFWYADSRMKFAQKTRHCLLVLALLQRIDLIQSAILWDKNRLCNCLETYVGVYVC